MDQLASEYAGQPVVFLEHDLNNPTGVRYYMWWASAKNLATLPFVMVDSGNECRNGPVSYHTVYSGMVDTSMARTAGAEITASQQRVGDTLHFEIVVTNRSGITLGSSNSAAVHVLVYEEAEILLTGRFVHDAPYTYLSPDLVDGASRSVSLDSAALPGVDWEKIHAVVVVDYRPGGGSGPYDMLQAAPVTGDLIFGDGFESGDLTRWSASAP